MIKQLLWKRFFCETDLRAKWKILVIENSRVQFGVHRKYLMEAPELHKTIPARKPCVTDVLCDR